ncbi:MAG: N-acetylmuramoyl-L-alanine amidase [Elusimicrobia bacterium]|nr:N-acetylmuramoyl-L-alanine amidase [Elusimicrobiota bacterium]
MRIRSLWLSFVFGYLPLLAAAQEPSVTIVYPSSSTVLPVLEKTLVVGHVVPSTASLQIGGQAVSVHRTGGFITYLPISPGEFVLQMRVEAGGVVVQSTHTLRSAEALPSVSADRFEIVGGSLQPVEDMTLRSGDWLFWGLKATPGGKVRCGVGGLFSDWPVLETREPGAYRGAYRIGWKSRAQEARIHCSLTHPRFWWSREIQFPGTVTVTDESHRVARVRTGNAVVRTAAGKGYWFFLPARTQVLVDGQKGREFRIWLSPSERGWMNASDLEFEPKGSAHRPATIQTVETRRKENSTQILLALDEKVPFRIRQILAPPAFEITFYQAVGHTNWMIYASKDPWVREIFWEQLGEGIYQARIALSQSPAWGYHAEYIPGALSLEIRDAPRWKSSQDHLLKGRVIAVDAGHAGGSPGAYGPLGTWEGDVNLQIAEKLKTLLERQGARVVMVRKGPEEVPLEIRPAVAWEQGAEIYLSVHNNALPDGKDPFAEPLGYSVFYYHPHSRRLAQEVHRAYGKHLSIPDNGLRYGDLLVTRLTEMPSVLTESAYLILPEQEEMLLSEAFQMKCAMAMRDGVWSFLRSYRHQTPR